MLVETCHDVPLMFASLHMSPLERQPMPATNQRYTSTIGNVHPRGAEAGFAHPRPGVPSAV